MGSITAGSTWRFRDYDEGVKLAALTRRIVLVLSTTLLIFLIGHTLYVARILAAWPEPQRSLKVASAILAGLLSLLYLALGVREMRGLPVPTTGLALPVLIVVGGNWLSDAFRLELRPFFILGGGAVTLGAWGLFNLLRQLARIDKSPPKAPPPVAVS